MRTRLSVVLVATLAMAAASQTGCASRRLDLTKSSTQMQFGVRMARANLWREALFRFERAVQIDPENAAALNNLAVAYEGIGEFEKARDAYARALKVDKSNQHIQKNYSRFVEFTQKSRKREAATTTTAASTTAPAATTTAPAATTTTEAATTTAPTAADTTATDTTATTATNPPDGGSR